jgi:hypothetical protein
MVTVGNTAMDTLGDVRKESMAVTMSFHFI